MVGSATEAIAGNEGSGCQVRKVLPQRPRKLTCTVLFPTRLRPKFGDVRFLEDKFELPEEVDNAGKDVVVVVHLTENV